MSAENSTVKVFESDKAVCIQVEDSERYEFESVGEMIHEAAVSRGKNAWALVGVITLGIGVSSAGFCLFYDAIHRKDGGEIIGGVSLFTTGISIMTHAPRFADKLR